MLISSDDQLNLFHGVDFDVTRGSSFKFKTVRARLSLRSRFFYCRHHTWSEQFAKRHILCNKFEFIKVWNHSSLVQVVVLTRLKGRLHNRCIKIWHRKAFCLIFLGQKNQVSRYRLREARVAMVIASASESVVHRFEYRRCHLISL